VASASGIHHRHEEADRRQGHGRAAAEMRSDARNVETPAPVLRRHERREAERAEAITQGRHRRARPFAGHRFHDGVPHGKDREAGERDQQGGAAGARQHRGPLRAR
jgi:hypothetical protein